MKIINLKSFEQSIREKKAAVYLVISKDEYERKVAADLLLKGKPKDQLILFEGQKLNIKDLLQELITTSFFVKERYVIVENSDKVTVSQLAPLLDYIASPNPNVCLILLAATFSKASNFYKTIEKTEVVLELAEEKSWEKEKTLTERLKQKLASENKIMDTTTINFFIKFMGLDAALLFQELEKLICYIGTRETITLQDIKDVVAEQSQETIWQLGDAIFTKNGGAALKIIESLLNHGNALIALLRQIRTQIQTKLQICSILENGTSQDVAQKFPYMKGNILTNNINQAQGYGMQRLQKAIIEIDETELKAKNSSTDTSLLAQILIIKLTK